VLTDEGPVGIEVPRDRAGIALYARGLTVREIQAFLKDAYAAEVSPDLISAVTDASSRK
jgi:transposase-like protein